MIESAAIKEAGFVGLGAMGLPMTRVLAGGGIAMSVADASEAALAAAGEQPGVSALDGAAAVAAAVPVLFTCLPNDAVVREVYLGAGGIGAAGRPGLITVDCSTVSPGATREVHEALKAAGISHLDASMLGSVAQAESGTLGFLVGGETAAFETVRPLLEILGAMVRHVGPSGAANRMKLVHQTLVAGHAVAVAEALALCLATETDLDAFYDIVCGGGGFAYSRYFEKRTPRMRDGDFSPLFMLDFMVKDAGLARDLARDAGMETPLLDRVLEVFAQAQRAGLGRDDFSAVARVYEQAVGRRLSEG